MAITLSTLDHLQNSLTVAKSTKQNKTHIRLPNTHHTLSMLLLYFGKFEIRNFALFMHVKHVTNMILYHLSNRYLSNVMKISAKIDTMRYINILLFVRLKSNSRQARGWSRTCRRHAATWNLACHLARYQRANTSYQVCDRSATSLGPVWNLTLNEQKVKCWYIA